MIFWVLVICLYLCLLSVLFICFCKSSSIYSKMKVFTFEWSSHPGFLTFKGYHFQVLWCDSVSLKSGNPEVFLKKKFWKDVANLQESTHAKVWFVWYSKLQSNFIEITLRYGCSEHLFQGTPLTGSFWNS